MEAQAAVLKFETYNFHRLDLGANHHLRQSLVFLNIPAMPQPEAYIGGADKLFDASGKLINEGTRKFLHQFMQAFADWISANTKT